MAFLKHLLPAWKRGIEDKRSTNAAILSALHEELSTAEKEAMKSKVLMSLDTSTGEWLDAYGRLFGVLRRDEEVDDSYRKRIIGYILLRRGTIPSIIEAIQNFLQDEDAQVEIYEPHNNIFYLNRSKLNGPDHLLGEYYTFAVIDIKISRPFSPAVMDVINEFKPAGVTVRLTYRPDSSKEGSIVELPLSNSEVKKTSRFSYIMNGMNDRINGHLNLTEGSKDSVSNLFVLNHSKLNSDDRLTGSYSMSNPSYSLASFTTSDLLFKNETTVGQVAQATEAMSDDFYTRTGAEGNGYALKGLNSGETSYLHFTMDLRSYLEENYATYLRKVEPDGMYSKETYLKLIDRPTLQYSIKATLPISSPAEYSVQMLDLSAGVWRDVESSEVHFALKKGKKSLAEFEKYISEGGVIFTRVKVEPNMDFTEVTEYDIDEETDIYDGGTFGEATAIVGVADGGSFPKPKPFDLHVHFFEIGFTKEMGVHPTIVPFVGEVTSQTKWYHDGRALDGGTFATTDYEKKIDGGTF